MSQLNDKTKVESSQLLNQNEYASRLSKLIPGSEYAEKLSVLLKE